jgi:anti-sigma-K factor RskA
MKAPSINHTARNISLGVLITLLVTFSASCSRKMVFTTSSVVPAAQGTVKVSKDRNNNYEIKISIKNLADVKRLQPQKQTYVVWMVTADGETKNIGLLTSSKKLSATLKTVSSSDPAKIFITAENDPGAQYPGEQLVLSTEIM